MRVRDYIYTNVTSELRSINQQSNSQSIREKIHKPVKTGVKAAALTFGYGLALTFITKKLKIFNSQIRNTLFINGIVALAVGLSTTYKNLQDITNNTHENKSVLDTIV